MRAFAHLPLRTGRLELRALRETDVAAHFGIHGDPEVMRYRDAPIRKDDRRARAMVARDLDQTTRDCLRLGIEPADGGTLLETCAPGRIDEQCRRAEIGFVHGHPSWGRGYMHEALSALIEYAFIELDLDRLGAETDPRNGRSTHLLVRPGFVPEDLFRERCIVEGEVSDSAMVGLLRREWRRAP